jgi:formate/nitrite transporter FocA (FNT family)
MLAAANMLALCFSRLASRMSAKTNGLAMTCVAALCCVLGLVGAGFDYSVANAASFSDDAVVGGTDLLAWDDILGNVLTGSLGIILAAAMVLALSLWTAPNASMKVASPQRQIYGEAD